MNTQNPKSIKTSFPNTPRATRPPLSLFRRIPGPDSHAARIARAAALEVLG